MDGRIYLSNEDGETLVVKAGALSDGVMYVRSSRTLFAIGRNR